MSNPLTLDGYQCGQPIECGFVTFNECSGVDCQRDCSAKITVIEPPAQSIISERATNALLMVVGAVLLLALVAGCGIAGVRNFHNVNIENMEP
jgi:hypothetical protein